MKQTTNLTNSQINTRIDDRIHSARDRRIMRLRLVDGLTYERIAETVSNGCRSALLSAVICAALRLTAASGAILAFQFEHGLDVDGVCGPKTQAALTE